MYNSNMGGVDLGDQWIATCPRLMKGNIWYYKVFFHMLEVAVLNAYIMYQGAGHQGVTLTDFKESIVKQLIEGNFFCWDTLSCNVPFYFFSVRERTVFYKSCNLIGSGSRRYSPIRPAHSGGIRCMMRRRLHRLLHCNVFTNF